MKVEHIKALQEKRLFQPFRIRMADGSTHNIQHPELLWVTQTLIGIASGIDDPSKGVPSKAVLCAPEHVVAIEMLSRSQSKAA